VTAFDVTIAGVQFKGLLRGDKPFHIEGNATVEILFWDVDVPIGPIEWGEKPPAPLPKVSLAALAAQALNAPEAWTPLLPPGANQLVGLSSNAPDGLTHPLGQLEVKQLQVPLEYAIDRVGSAGVDTRRINLRAPKLGAVDAGAVWPVNDRFSPGHFLELSDDQVLARPEFEELQAGLGMAATQGASFPDAVHTGYGWNTVCPGETFGFIGLLAWDLRVISAKTILANASVKARRERDNPYDLLPKPKRADILTERGAVEVVRRDTMEPLAAGLMSPGAAATIVAAQGPAARGFTTLVKGFLA
jgi:hypothetical protein